MAKYRKKPVVIEAISFDEFVTHAKENTPEPHWHVVYKGVPFTHQNDALYLFHNGSDSHHFTPKDMLITGVNGEVYPCPVEVFEKIYEPA